MDYIKLEENLRVGFEVKASYFGNELIIDLVEFDELLKDNLFIQGGYVKGVPEFEDIFERLEDKVSVLDDIKHSNFNSKYIIESLEYEIFLEEEWFELVGNRTIKEIKKDLLGGKLKELEKILSELKISEFYHSKEIIEDMIEEDKINLVLENMKVIKGCWRGYSQGDYVEYYTIITYNSKEEKEELENKIVDKFNYLDILLNGDVYDTNIAIEERKLFREIGGEEEKNIWTVKELDNYGGVVIDYLDLEEELKQYIKNMIPKKYHEEVDNKSLEFEIIY